MRLSAADARRLLTTAAHAVLAVNDAEGPPLVVPVTVAALDVGGTPCLAFAVDHKPKSGARLRRLRLVEADPRVAVLAEHYEADWSRLWWARADGRAEVLGADDEGPRRAALSALAAVYPQYVATPPTGEVVLVRVERWSGWSGAAAEPSTTEPPTTGPGPAEETA